MDKKKSIYRRDFLKYTGFGFAGLALPWSAHARIARIGLDDALWMTDVLMHKNARKLYNL
jgi:hypothetical protein